MKKWIILLIGILLIAGVTATVSFLNSQETKIIVGDNYFYELNDTKTKERTGYKFEPEGFVDPKAKKVGPYTMNDVFNILEENRVAVSLQP